MRFRNLDVNGDWTFGKGRGNYVLDTAAVALNIQTRLYEFLNDCFFDADRGIDWWNILGTNNEAEILFAIHGVILNTSGVQSVLQVDLVRDERRRMQVKYQVTTTFGDVVNANLLPAPVVPFVGISKYVATIVFNNETTKDVDVSSRIADAHRAVFQVYDVAGGYTEIVGVVQVISTTTVRITINPAFNGSVQLVGIA